MVTDRQPRGVRDRLGEALRRSQLGLIDDSAAIDVKTAPVDQEELRTLIGDAIKDAEADDPKNLKTEIARLKVELAKKPATMPVADVAAVETARREGVADGHARGLLAGRVEAYAGFERDIRAYQGAFIKSLAGINWGGPDEPRTEHCSYCGDKLPTEDEDPEFVPLILWNERGWCAEFCDHCAAAWFGAQSFSEPPAEDDDAPPPELGPCCMCGGSGARTIVMLNRRCRGYPATEGRIAIADLPAGEFDHDTAKHADEQ